jgi:3-dehydroquinate synthase
MAALSSGVEMSMREVVTVALGERSYPIVIGAGVLDECGERLAAVCRPGRCALVTNPVVARLYAEQLKESLMGSGFDPIQIEIADGERYKTLDSVSHIYDVLLEAKLDRKAPLLALGGGVIGDLTGFAAATYLRGVPFVQVPTTLLAQVDSSVGGKTGVNHPLGKNLIGAFHQPVLVLSDSATLRTLPRRELVAGLVEVIKYGVILDAALFARIEEDLDALLALDERVLGAVIRRCCELKAEVVGADEREADYRAILNFGHTLGHGIESETQYSRYLHGEAVSIGMSFAAHFSASRGYCPPAVADRVVRLLRRLGAPTEVPTDLQARSLQAALAGDKKAAGGQVKFVFMEGLGRTRFEMVSAREIAERAVAGAAEH